ncbi:hypothetical protein BB559_005832 [Furculomyces boomerangus]|uniref:DNA repair protein RAD50 n=1 Tax=Furculomyces boomerangus TaxID=61424 RepID=A0A2T9Y6F5_9FUNG|nr:hypothetical protein BB559_005832 [Furculomyces boomerangus]
MSAIERLLISGIRSFDPNNRTVIKFSSPLTLIVGANGCGKTTIIECLKYATTGELPPNSKGGAFVNDPKIAGEAEIKAQVKLEFRNVNGKKMVCTRSLQVTQKRTGITMQTLEGVLTIPSDKNTGQEKVSVSSKCAELDLEMPIQLGISKAILENVIFCHQEESNWPLSEPLTLKKKFDDIFAATRYTKAVESFKKVRKEQAIELKIQSNDLKHFSENKKKSDRIKLEIEAASENISTLKNSISELSEKETTFEKRLSLFETYIEEFNSVEMEYKQLQHEKTILEQNLEELLSHIVIMDNQTEELNKILNEQENEKNRWEEIIASKNLKINKDNRKIEKLQLEISIVQQEIGKLEAQKAAHGEEIIKLNKLMKELITNNSLTINNWPNSLEIIEESEISKESAPEELCIAIKDEVDRKYKDYFIEGESLKGLIKSEEEENREFLYEKELLKSKTKQEMEQTMVNINKSTKEISNIKKKIEETKFSESELLELNEKLEKEMSSLDNIVKEKSKKNLNEKINKKRKEMNDIDYEILLASEEAAKSQRNSEMLGKAEITKKTLETKKNSFNKIFEELVTLSSGLISHATPIQDILQISAKHLQKTKTHASNAEKELEKSKSFLSSIETKTELLQDSLSGYKNEILEKEKLISSLCPDNQYESSLFQLQQQADGILEDLGKQKSQVLLYKTYITEAKNTKSCPLCIRGWKKPIQMEEFVAKLEKTYDTAPQLIRDAQNRLEKAQKELNDLRSMQPNIERIHQLTTNNIPELEEKLLELTKEKTKLESKHGKASRYSFLLFQN